ncbi:hypothetical protein ACE1CI_02300 [Aerosakkonemataceae cyanobacterium BLCC-F50]|uniref:Uncharacterized protein n=1 Tax=Floridaenema flaviceps BLCC-F50 TaxID=3153642 RepID=A0ABV4XKI9_9CYAN
MFLKPLGLKNPLNPPISLGQKSHQPLQAPPPLGQSANPLGQILQPLGESVRSPLVQASFFNQEIANSWFVPDLMTSGNREEDIATRQQDNTLNSPVIFSPSSPSESVITKSSLPNPTVRLAEDMPSSKDIPTTNLSNVTENRIHLKPLGIPKPLVQESDLLISNQPELSPVIQNKSINEKLISNLDYSTPAQVESTNPSSDSNLAERISLTPVNLSAGTESSDLPKINSLAEKNLSFNKQLISPSTAESLEKSQSSSQETPNSGTVKANWYNPELEKSVTTPLLQPSTPLIVQGHLETDNSSKLENPSDSANTSSEPITNISPSLGTSLLKETATSQGETPVQTKENFTYSTTTLVDSSVSHDTADTSSNLIYPSRETTTTASSESTLQADAIENVNTKPDLPVSSNRIQTSREISTATQTSQTTPLGEDTFTPARENVVASSGSPSQADAIDNLTTKPDLPVSSNRIQTSREISTATQTSQTTPLGENAFTAASESVVASSESTLQADAIENVSTTSDLPIAPNRIQLSTEISTATQTSQTTPLAENAFTPVRENVVASSETASQTDAIENVKTTPDVPIASQEATFAQAKEDFTVLSPIANQKTDLVDNATAASHETESPNFVSPNRERFTTLPLQETVALKEETFSSDQKELAVSSPAETISDTVSNALASPNLISPTTKIPTATPTQEAVVPQPETFVQAQEDLGFLPSTTTETEGITPAATNVVSTSLEISTSKDKQTFVEDREDLNVTSNISESQPNKVTPTLPSIQPNKETVIPKSTQEITATPQIINQKTDITDDATVTLDKAESLNLVSPNVSTAVPTPETVALKEETFVPTQETVAPQKKAFPSDQEELTTSSTIRSQSETVSDRVIPVSPNLISPKTEAIAPAAKNVVSPTDYSNREDITASSAISPPQAEKISDTQVVPNRVSSSTIRSQSESVSDRVTPVSPNLISPKTEAIAPAAKNVVSSTDYSNREDVTALSAIAPPQTEKISDTQVVPNRVSSPNFIQPKLDTPTTTTTPETVVLQPESFVQPKEDLAFSSSSTKSETRSETITPSQPSLVQSRLENSSLNTLQPLGFSKPLMPKTDLVNSSLMADFIEESTNVAPDKSLSDNSSSEQISRSTESNVSDSSFSTELISPKSSSQEQRILPDSEKSLSEMNGEESNQNTESLADLPPLGFSKSLNNTNNFILSKLDLSPASGQAPKSIGFDEPPNSSPSVKDVPNSWSSISELLGEKSPAVDKISSKEDGISPLLSLMAESPNIPDSLSSPSLSSSNIPNNSGANSEEIASENSINDNVIKNLSKQDEQLDLLAQKVYTLMRQRLEISQEHHGRKGVGQPIWLSNITSIYGTSAYVKAAPKRASPGQESAADFSEVSPVDDKLQQLTREVYWQIQQKVEIARERQGHYYTGRLPW